MTIERVFVLWPPKGQIWGNSSHIGQILFACSSTARPVAEIENVDYLKNRVILSKIWTLENLKKITRGSYLLGTLCLIYICFCSQVSSLKVQLQGKETTMSSELERLRKTAEEENRKLMQEMLKSAEEYGKKIESLEDMYRDKLKQLGDQKDREASVSNLRGSLTDTLSTHY